MEEKRENRLGFFRFFQIFQILTENAETGDTGKYAAQNPGNQFCCRKDICAYYAGEGIGEYDSAGQRQNRDSGREFRVLRALQKSVENEL